MEEDPAARRRMAAALSLALGALSSASNQMISATSTEVTDMASWRRSQRRRFGASLGMALCLPLAACGAGGGAALAAPSPSSARTVVTHLDFDHAPELSQMLARTTLLVRARPSGSGTQHPDEINPAVGYVAQDMLVESVLFGSLPQNPITVYRSGYFSPESEPFAGFARDREYLLLLLPAAKPGAFSVAGNTQGELHLSGGRVGAVVPPGFPELVGRTVAEVADLVRRSGARPQASH